MTKLISCVKESNPAFEARFTRQFLIQRSSCLILSYCVFPLWRDLCYGIVYVSNRDSVVSAAGNNFLFGS